MRTLCKLATLVMVALALAGALRAAEAVAGIAGTRARLDRAWDGTPMRTSLAGVRVQRLDGPRSGETVDLGTLSRAVVFVFEPSCPASNANVANWADLVRDAPPGAPVYALTYMRSSPERVLEYWEGMRGRVPVLATDTASLVRRIRVAGTPATLVVRDGTVRRVIPGFLQPDTKKKLLRVLWEDAGSPRPAAGAAAAAATGRDPVSHANPPSGGGPHVRT